MTSGGQRVIDLNHRDVVFALALPLLARFVGDGAEVATKRLGLLLLVFLVAYAWSAIFSRKLWQKPAASQFAFAMLYTLLLPVPVAWFGTLLAASFGWVFGREIFGGKAILSPAMVALAFAIFSFPKGGYETRMILTTAPNAWLALACLPGAAWLWWKSLLPWRLVLGAMIGATFVSGFFSPPGTPAWWEHFIMGSFAVGILFLAAAPENMPRIEMARWFHGLAVGALIVFIRLADPQQPDGIVFAALLGALFAPLLDRAFSWRLQRE